MPKLIRIKKPSNAINKHINNYFYKIKPNEPEKYYKVTMRVKKIFILMLSSLFPIVAFSLTKLTKEDALKIAQQQFKGRDVDYYLLKNYNPKYWNVFVDAAPMTGWEHECYILSIPMTISPAFDPSRPTNLNMVRRNLPPADDYIPLSVKNRFGTNANSKPIVKKVSQSNAATTSNRTYAIILSGGVNKLSNYERYWNDCSFIYQTLVNKYGVPKENIFPLMSDGDNPAEDMWLTAGGFASQSLDLDNDGVNEIKLAATKSNIRTILDNLKTKLQKDDHLFFYVIDHGGSTDNISSSYINLWNYEELYDYELAEMLTPFTDKFVNVNVVLGQCFSGGFNDDLTKVGCVVASACTGSEPSWACLDKPYDEFVYHWTCAVNGATHQNVKVNADIDKNDRVTMEEAFDYAKANDRITDEHPQYVSTPISVGEDLAFNNLAKSVDLYIKDNPEDTGKEPNMTIDEFWKSPSIWVRNQDDSIEVHENPIYSSNHRGAVVYVKIHNRGKEKYTGGQWLHVYWAKASTGFNDRTWKGRELYNGEHVTGGHLEAIHIPEIDAGGFKVVGVNWGLPSMLGSTSDNKHHFCLLAKIMDSHYDEKYEEGKAYFNMRWNNDQAQKNVSIIHKEDYSNGTLVYVRNVNNQAKNYSLELVPRTENDKAIYNRAEVKLGLSPTIYKAWERGGFQSQDIIVPTSNSNDTNLKTVKLISPQSKLRNVSLAGKEFDVVNLKFDFKEFEAGNKTYTFDLIQKDESGEIIGGETFIVETPELINKAIEIKTMPMEGGEVQLSVDEDGFEQLTWFDDKGTTLDKSESVIVTPTRDNNKYTVVAYTPEGNVATESISFESELGIKSVTISTDSSNIVVELNGNAVDNTSISIISVLDGNTKIIESVPKGAYSISIDTTSLVKGIYGIVYTIEGVVIDQKKINIE